MLTITSNLGPLADVQRVGDTPFALIVIVGVLLIAILVGIDRWRR